MTRRPLSPSREESGDRRGARCSQVGSPSVDWRALNPMKTNSPHLFKI